MLKPLAATMAEIGTKWLELANLVEINDWEAFEKEKLNLEKLSAAGAYALGQAGVGIAEVQPPTDWPDDWLEADLEAALAHLDDITKGV